MEFRLRFSQMKHSLNNALAVFMALSELTRRNPDYYEKLAQAITTRIPEMTSVMQDFSAYLDSRGPVS